MRYTDIKEAVQNIQSGDRIFFQGAAMTPVLLINALCERYKELEQVEICQAHTEGNARYTQAPYNKSFKVNSFFVGSNIRSSVNGSNGDYMPIFLSEIHHLFRQDILPLDAAFIQVSEPDAHGYCSLGTSVDITLPAVEKAKRIIAQVNPNIPRTHGDGIIHSSKIDIAVHCDVKMKVTETNPLSETEKQIGKNVANLIDNGATLQMGIGNIPNAVLANLRDHKGLGIHTEMFSDGILPLVQKGVITGEHKIVKHGKIVTCFAIGSQELYDFVDDNPIVHFKEAAYTNDTAIIRRNPKVTAINSAIEIDLTGQVCADTIGGRQYSGVGGQMDFIRGASLSKGGKPIFAMTSTTAKGISKITPFLNQGAGVTTTRAHVHYVVTEYGVANLFGKNLKQRAKALIDIAHPDFREQLSEDAFKRFGGLQF
ncbi:MAG: acetyl-CoA hydrolase/transferase family protein [Flavobacteriales bacterium]|jgi:acyl-CoA hydrolase|uniref:acetyl-CoA hydrolase/transferase family protein n=1 Tax=Candidatus Ulvibacter alkanivorans TaxID=2267620 RepID=UPI000DF268FF|nr:acetyl-CoA hydrolase/transferase C-terminal domain-containing protein [Candidatus Ulvibacter alkanivorans]MCH2489370.1 acetyl-CoA hydrolase/transferase family protein [Flavobacteriales bacterium]